MATKNQVIENPVIGDKVKFLVTSAESKGALLRVELWCTPGAPGTPMHRHPKQRETFEVLSGSLGIDDDGKKIVLRTGEKYSVSPDSAHRFYNASADEEVRVIVDLEPALKTEFFFETMYALARQGKTGRNALPSNPLQFAAIMHEYEGEMLAVGPPVFVQSFLAKIVGRLAKLLGFKGIIPYK